MKKIAGYDSARIQKIKRAGLLKKASYEYINDSVNLTDVVTAGYDLNEMDDESLVRASTQECFAIFKDMLDHTDFSTDEWQRKLGNLLIKGGLSSKKRVTKVSKKSVEHMFSYIRSLGWD